MVRSCQQSMLRECTQAWERRRYARVAHAGDRYEGEFPAHLRYFDGREPERFCAGTPWPGADFRTVTPRLYHGLIGVAVAALAPSRRIKQC
jgi:hypothetical protein